MLIEGPIIQCVGLSRRLALIDTPNRLEAAFFATASHTSENNTCRELNFPFPTHFPSHYSLS